MRGGAMRKQIILGFLTALTVVSVQAQSPAPRPQIFFAALNAGQWDIFSVSPDGKTVLQLTNDEYEDSDPAISPDGNMLAYASRRGDNWDIFLLNLKTGAETRLTDNPQYDGAPAWHPDGRQIAFESFRSGDLDVWLMDATADATPLNLTADSPAQDYAPTWDDTGDVLFFASARAGDDDIWALNIRTRALTQLTTAETSEGNPQWDARRGQVGFVANRLGEKDIFFATATDEMQQFSWLLSVTGFAISPDGTQVAAVLRGENTDRLVRLDVGDPVPHYLSSPILLQGKPSWSDGAVVFGAEVHRFEEDAAGILFTETTTPSGSPYGEPYDVVRLNDLKVGIPWLADTVDESFRTMRSQLRAEVGYDFLGELSEALRPINFASDASQYSSWHKSGRAIDTRFDLPDGRMQIVKENVGGNTYWRVLLRCEDQSGRCGKPATARPWDYSGYARTVLAPEQGGVEKPPLHGYYVDFTTWARMFGWQRIASHNGDEFSWTWHFKAFEYWHFQKPFFAPDGSSDWYAALRQVYPPDDVDTYFNWRTMRAAGEDPQLIFLKGVSAVPPAAKRWWQQLTQ